MTENSADQTSTVYLGSFAAQDGLRVGSVDDATGELTLTGVIGGVPNPTFLALSADRAVLYSGNELPEGTVTALELAGQTVLTTADSGGSGPTHVSVHAGGKFLLAANYSDGSVAAHRIEGDGRIGELTSVVATPGPYAHQVLSDPSGQWVVAVVLGADAVMVYRLDEGSGELTEHSRLSLPAGAGPRHLAFHPGGGHAYVLGELRSEITVAAWDPGTGTLTAGQVIPTVGEGAPDPNYPAEVVVAPDGRFVYATNRGEDTVAVFAVRDGGARLAFDSSVPTGGQWPRHCVLNPAGDRLYVANQNSDTVTWLDRDPATGRLSAPGGSAALESVVVLVFG